MSRECLAGGGPCLVINFLSGPNTTPKSKTRYLELVCWWAVTIADVVLSWRGGLGSSHLGLHRCTMLAVSAL